MPDLNIRRGSDPLIFEGRQSSTRRGSAPPDDSHTSDNAGSTLSRSEEKKYKTSKGQLRRASRRLSLIKFVGRLVVEPRLPGFLQVFNKIKPLVLNLTSLPKIRAFRAFKFLARLQKVCGVPYIPDLEQGRQLDPRQDGGILKRMNRYCLYAIGVYNSDLLHNNGFKIDKDADTGYLITSRLNACVIAARDQAKPTRPAWFLYSDTSNKELVLAIQGSTSANDWLTNLLCAPSKTGAHEGMCQAATHIGQETREIIFGFMQKKPKFKLVLTGHSLGGGCAALLLMRWHSEGTAMPESITSRMEAWAFGTPCYAAMNVGRPYENKIHSITFGRDIVGRASYGSFRDFLLTLHGLCHTMTRNGKQEILQDLRREVEDHRANEDAVLGRVSHTVDTVGEMKKSALEIIHDDKSSDGSDSDMEIDTVDDDDEINDENLVTPFSTRIEFPTYEAPFRQLETVSDLALDVAKTHIKLPLPFKQLNKIVKKRAVDFDRRSNQLKADLLRQTEQSGFLKLYACCATTGGMSPVHPKGDLNRIAEDEILLRTLLGVQAAAISPDEQMMAPAGSYYLIISRIDFLEQDRVLPRLPFNKGDCTVFHFSREAMLRIIKEPVWSIRAILDHSGSLYAQCCNPEILMSPTLASPYITMCDEREESLQCD
eukprot:Blabericola_migrator_1__6226@NODE_313_length_10046_cov_122_852390_g256_i0_p3_GENE_NODE_313_length_10046_cov_122_852390_g256_i0NODE_313_length_10046_cov_122_852390_g256_i0_p3_ORF_typecomplete_len655_score118_37Lipase_3/PF01764_25/8_9e22DUF2974/PF11187_8/1_4e06Abhydrolase_3/PF07859_13/0_038DUF676/PF05057_14/0_3DUF676/PF05057_14/4_5e03Hydrolase_4/PF12146_8/0_26_NODE_313_length_10046_cov_122_852390_g256_i078949858